MTKRVCAVLAIAALGGSALARAENPTPPPLPPTSTSTPPAAGGTLQIPGPPPKDTPPSPVTPSPPSPQAQPIEPPLAVAPVKPPAPALGPAPTAAPVPAPSPPPGQWVYTGQYGWLWMPYDRAYTYVPSDASVAYSYVYYPVFGWRWVVAPWVLGFGVAPVWGVLGPVHFGWYVRPWFRVGVPFRGPGWGRRPAGPPAFRGAPRGRR